VRELVNLEFDNRERTTSSGRRTIMNGPPLSIRRESVADLRSKTLVSSLLTSDGGVHARAHPRPGPLVTLL